MDFYIIAIVILTIISIFSFLFFRYISAVEKGVSINKKEIENLKQLIINFKKQERHVPIVVNNQMKSNIEKVREYISQEEKLEEINLGKAREGEEEQHVQENIEEQQIEEQQIEEQQIEEQQIEEQQIEEEQIEEEDNEEEDNEEEDNEEEESVINLQALEELEELEGEIVEELEGDEQNENQTQSIIIDEEYIRNMKVAELRKLAEEWNIENAEEIKKPELKEMLIQKLSIDNVKQNEQ